MKFRLGLFLIFFVLTSGGYSAVVNTKADIAPGVIENSHITTSSDPTKKIDLSKISGLSITAPELNYYDPTGKTAGYVPTSDGAGHITWLQLGGGLYLPLAGGTMTGSILADSTGIDIGSTIKPFGYVYSLGAEFLPVGGGTAFSIYPDASFSGNYIEVFNNSGSGPSSWMTLDNAGLLTVDNLKLTGLLSAGSLATDASGNIIAGAGGGGGAVSSVGLSVPSWLSVTGSPITSAGTLAITSATGLTNDRVLGTTAGSLTLRQITSSDIAPPLTGSLISGGTFGPVIGSALTNLTATNLVGQVPAANGGTGSSNLTSHGVVIGQGTSPVHVTTPGTDGQVLMGVTGFDPIFTNILNSMLPNSGVTAGTYTLPTLTIDAKGVITSASSGGTLSGTAVGGDLTGTVGSATVAKINGKTAPSPVSGDNGKVLTYNSGTNAYTLNTPTTGTVTSVGLTVPSFLNVTGSPITSTGTLAIGTPTGLTAAQVLATDPSTTSAVALRSLSAAHIPNLDTSKITSGNFTVPRGGTGAATLPTTLLQGNGTSPITGVTVGTGLSLSGGTLSSTVTGAGNHAATVIVAANDTLAAAKAGADFTGTSTDGSTAILAAIAALPSNGGHIKLLDGTYIALATIPITKNNVVIEGSGWNTIIRRGYNESGTNGIFTIGNGSTLYTGIQLKNLMIDGNKGTYTTGPNNPNIVITNNADYVTLDHVQSMNSMNRGVYSGGTPDYLTIKDCMSNINGGIGIQITGTHVNIDHTKSLNDGAGIRLAGSNHIIDHNLIDTPTGAPGSFLGHGIWLDTVAGFTLDNNTVLNPQGNGYRFTGTDYSGTGTGNICFGTIVSTYSGFDLNGTLDVVLTNNSSMNGSASGFLLTGATRTTLTGNQAYSNTRYGIEIVSGTTVTLSGNALGFNTLNPISDAGTGTIYLNQSDGTNLKSMGQAASFTGVKVPTITSSAVLGTDASGNVQTSTAANGITPIGGIIMWSGSIASIPAHWHLCDGTTGTPDLRDRFVIGAGTTYAVAATGGSTHHQHTFSGTTSDTTATNQAATDSGITSTAGSHHHSIPTLTVGMGSSDSNTSGYLSPSTGIAVTLANSTHVHTGLTLGTNNTGDDGSHFHNLIMNGHNHLQNPHNHAFSGSTNDPTVMPPYYSLAFIQRVD